MGVLDVLLPYLIKIPGIIIAVGVHEYVKAMASTRLGDTSPKREGRCTLNLFKHIDPLGFIFMLLFKYGWGKPVNTSAIFYNDRKKDTLIVYILPSVANVLLAVIFLSASVLVNSMTDSSTSNTIIETALWYLYFIFRACAEFNISFAILNIIPIYPLDGAKVLNVFLKPQTVINMTQYEKILQLILVFLILMGIIDQIIAPISNAFLSLIYRF